VAAGLLEGQGSDYEDLATNRLGQSTTVNPQDEQETDGFLHNSLARNLVCIEQQKGVLKFVCQHFLCSEDLGPPYVIMMTIVVISGDA
jgi:hypothetical protein